MRVGVKCSYIVSVSIRPNNIDPYFFILELLSLEVNLTDRALILEWRNSSLETSQTLLSPSKRWIYIGSTQFVKTRAMMELKWEKKTPSLISCLRAPYHMICRWFPFSLFALLLFVSSRFVKGLNWITFWNKEPLSLALLEKHLSTQGNQWQIGMLFLNWAENSGTLLQNVIQLSAVVKTGSIAVN